MDGIGAGVVETAPVVGATPESSTGEEAGASKTEEQAGGEQPADGGSVDGQQGRERGKSVYAKVRELQSQLRDQRGYWESEVGSLKQQLEEIRSHFGSRQAVPKQGKTFFEAPEDVLSETLNSHLSEFEKRMFSKFEQTQADREAASERAQEVSEAAKFIRSQKGISDEDIQDIREILQSNPDLNGLSPMKQAKYALMEWKESRGIMDNTARKNRASTVTGAAVSTATGKKIWSKSEIETELAKFPPNPANYTPEDEARFKKLDDEWRRASREGRMTN